MSDYIQGRDGRMQGSRGSGILRAARLRAHAEQHEEVVGKRQEAVTSARKKLAAIAKKQAKGKATAQGALHAAALKQVHAETALQRAIATRKKIIGLAVRAAGKPSTTDKAKAAAGRLKELKDRLAQRKQSDAELAKLYPNSKSDYSRLHMKIAKRERLLDRLLKRESRAK